MTQDLKTPPQSKASGPTAAAKRFVAQVMEYAFREGWRTPDDFLRFFPPEALMEALKSAPELRVAILGGATGMHEQILQRKSLRLAAEDLRLALSEGVYNGFLLLEAFGPEERIRHLDVQRLWDFLIEDRFWQVDHEATPELLRGAAARLSFTLNVALKEKLLTLRDVLDAWTYDSVADSLSPDELRRVVRHALTRGRDGVALNEKTLLDVLPLEKLIGCVPLDHTWNEVIVKRVAVPCKLQSERAPSVPARPPAPVRALPPRPAERAPVSTPAVTRVAQPSPTAQGFDGMSAPRPQPVAAPSAPLPVVAPSAPPPALQTPAPSPLAPDFESPLVLQQQQQEAELQQRQRVTEHLRSIGRLPLKHERMPLVVLRSIDAMYSLLPSATDDIQRKSVIRAAFSGDHHLRMALLGLIELMDSSVDTSDPVIQEAKIDALIKILLFEEQRRKETGRAHDSLASPAFGMGGAPGRYASVPSRGSYPPPSYQRGAASGGYRDSAPPGPASDRIGRGAPASRRRTLPPPLPPGMYEGGDIPGSERLG